MAGQSEPTGLGEEAMRVGQPTALGPPSDPISIAAARLLYERSGSGHDFDHVLRVMALAEQIARAEGADLTVVRTAALLHDVGENEGRQEHHLRGAAIAREILRDYPSEFVEAVAHAIEAHRFRMDPAPRTLEARVVSDADKLDAIGAIGIARVFAHAGARGTALWRVPWREIASSTVAEPEQAVDQTESCPSDLSPEGELQPVAGKASSNANSGPRVLGPAYTPVHEYVYKLDRIPERLFTTTARAVAVERRAFMQAFFDRLDEEMRGLLVGGDLADLAPGTHLF